MVQWACQAHPFEGGLIARPKMVGLITQILMVQIQILMVQIEK